MEALNTNDNENKFLLVNNTRNYDTFDVPKPDFGPDPSTMVVKPGNATEGEAQSMTPVDPEAGTSDRNEVVSFDDESELYTGMRQTNAFHQSR